jgi:anti-anti-sigma regulatory factor
LDTTGKEYVLRELRRLYVDASVLRYESSMAYEELVQLVEAVTEEEERLVLRTVRGETVDEFAARSDFYESMKRLAISLE